MENRLLGRCRLTRKLGEGGMGEVWLARHETLDKDVAVKILPLEKVEGDRESVQRFIREAQSAARLEHPNIVQVLDAGSSEGVHYIVMQFVDGTDLQQVIRKRGKLAVGEALSVAKKVAQALGAAHRIGLIHRDIKPANVLVTKQGKVMVTDFGLARSVDSGGTLTTAEQIIGTPQYLSPEQAQGEKLDGRTDLYSLGAMLYTLLSGKMPFTGNSPLSIALKHCDAKSVPEPLRKSDPAIPEEAEALVAKLMAKKREERFQSAEEVVAAIDRIKSANAGVVTVTSDKVLTPQRRRRLMMVGAGFGIGGLFLLIIVLGILGPGKAEKAYRHAGTAATEAEKLVRLKAVVDGFPGTPWAGRAASDSASIRAAILDREILAVKALVLQGTIPLRDGLVRLDALKPTAPSGGKALEAAERDLHVHRLQARTKAFGDALRQHRPLEADQSIDRIKEFVLPESVRKVGEGGIRGLIAIYLALLTEYGGRVEEVESPAAPPTVENRQRGVVPVRVTFLSRAKRERSVHVFDVHWVWQDGDWYLAADKALQERK
jgi:hypothetical protein